MSMRTGRPTKYREDMPQRVLNYVDEAFATGKIPTIQGLSCVLEVDEDTIGNWGKKYPSFFGAVKRLKQSQADNLQNKGLRNEFNPTMCIFLLKNNHGFTDRQNIDITSKGKSIPAPILANVSSDDSDKENTETTKED